jgi:lipoate-protein ligase A
MGLQKLDAPVRLQKRHLDLANHYRSDVSMSCFSAAARHEILLKGKKLVGSAQRHLTRGILQHGSILTGPDHLDLPCFLAGFNEAKRKFLRDQIASRTISLSEYLKRPVPYEEVTPVLRQGMMESLQIHFKESELKSYEIQKMKELKGEFGILSKNQ